MIQDINKIPSITNQSINKYYSFWVVSMLTIYIYVFTLAIFLIINTFNFLSNMNKTFAVLVIDAEQICIDVPNFYFCIYHFVTKL